MRKIGVVLIGGIIVLIAGSIAVWLLADPNRHRDLIQTQLEAQLGRKVTLGEMSLGLFPLRFQVQNPTIAEDPRIASQQPFVRAEKLDVRINLLPLLRGNVQVNAVELHRPIVELIRTRQGVWNFASLGPTAAPAAAPDDASTSNREFSLDRLTIVDGQLGVADLQQKSPRSTYDHIGLTVRNYAAGKPFDFDLAARIQGQDPLDVHCRGEAEIAEGLVKIPEATLEVGQTPLSASGVLNTNATPVHLDLRVKSTDVSITEIARAASALGIAFAPGTTVTGRLSADIQAKGPVTTPALTGKISGRDLNISGQGIPQPVAVKAINLDLSPTVIRSEEFNATSGKTTVVGRFAIQQYTSNSPSVDVALRSPGATLPEIQSIAKAYGMTGLDQLSGDGSLNFDLRAKGPLQSLTTASATRALNGVINLDFSPLKVLGFDTVHQLANLGGFGSGLTEQKATDIIRVVGRIVVKDGIAETDDLKATLGSGNLAATGTADLATEALNLKMSAVFSKAFSEKVTPTRAANFMNAAFSNSSGEIVLPAIVTGTFTKPKFAPDFKALAQLQKQKYIPSLDNPTGAINNVLGVLKGRTDKSENAEEQPAGQKPSVVKGILDALGGGKGSPPK